MLRHRVIVRSGIAINVCELAKSMLLLGEDLSPSLLLAFQLKVGNVTFQMKGGSQWDAKCWKQFLR